MHKVILEVPPHYAKSLDVSYSFINNFSGLADRFNLTDMPLGRVTVDNCAFIAGLSNASAGKIISTISVGHRDALANRSYIRGLLLLGVKQMLLVQGPSRISKVSELLPYAINNAEYVGTQISNELKTRERISAGVKFFVTNMYPNKADVLMLSRLGFSGEVMISVPEFEDRADASRLIDKGFQVPKSVIDSNDPGHATRRILIDLIEAAEEAGLTASAYIVPLRINALKKWLEDLLAADNKSGS